MKNVIGTVNKLLIHDLTQLDQLIAEVTHTEINLLNNIVKYMQKMSGKRLRILLLLLIGKTYNYSGPNILYIAAAIEFIHNATLLHDDVIDNNHKRRGIYSANKIWHNKACVLVGDFLLSHAFNLIIKVNNKTISEILSNSSCTIIKGEIKQFIYNNNYNDLDIGKYLEIIEGKTASLFAAATSIGGILGSASQEEITALHNFGNYLGIAFQIIDDLLDYTGNSKTLGKPIGNDFKESKITLPIIFVKQKLIDNNQLELWDELWPTKRKRTHLKKMIEIILKLGVDKLVLDYAAQYINQAKDAIKIIHYRKPFYQLLIEIADFALIRNK